MTRSDNTPLVGGSRVQDTGGEIPAVGNYGDPIEVDLTVNAPGLTGLAGRQPPVGYHFAGRRVTVRLDRGLLQLIDDGVLLRSLPNPLTLAEAARIRDARPAGPPPMPAAEPMRVERRVSCRGAVVVTRQRIHVGMVHAGRTVTVEAADHTFRVYADEELLAEVARTTTKTIARFKVRKPEPARRRPVSSADHLDTSVSERVTPRGSSPRWPGE